MTADVQAAREAVEKVRAQAQAVDARRWQSDGDWVITSSDVGSIDIAGARSWDDAAHIVAFDPASVLADCDDALKALDDAEDQQERHENSGMTDTCLYCDDVADGPCEDRQAADRTVARVLAWAQRHGGAA